MSSPLPSAIADVSRLAARLREGPFAVFLDYDGTLTPIAATPDLARLDDAQRRRLRRLAESHRVAVVTGRALADIRSLVGLPALHYAANHGFQIVGPDVAFEYDPALRARFDRAATQLAARIAHVPGVVIEAKGYSVALHFRLAPKERVPELDRAVDEVIAAGDGLRKTSGKMVLEIRPTEPWDKGAAVGWLVARWGRPLPVVLGDDRTDEDAFRFVADHGGIGIVVGEPTWETAASHRVRDVDEVGLLLDAMAALP